MEKTQISIIEKSAISGKEIDVYGTIEEPLFRAKDVADWIAHSDVHKMIAAVDEDEKVRKIIPTLGGNQEVWMLTENGLYEVLMLSRKKEAKLFKKGVKKVLHEIRTKGGYIATRQDDSPEMIMARALKIADETIKRNKERLKELELTTQKQAQEIEVKDAQITELNTAVSEMQPKVSYVDTILQCKDTVQTSIIAQDYGKTAKAFNILLRNFGIQRKIGTTWVLYAKHISNGYVQSKTFKYRHKDGTEGARTYSEWTQRGRLFLYDTLKKHGILPLIEKSSTLTNEAK